MSPVQAQWWLAEFLTGSHFQQQPCIATVKTIIYDVDIFFTRAYIFAFVNLYWLSCAPSAGFAFLHSWLSWQTTVFHEKTMGIRQNSASMSPKQPKREGHASREKTRRGTAKRFRLCWFNHKWRVTCLPTSATTSLYPDASDFWFHLALRSPFTKYYHF